MPLTDIGVPKREREMRAQTKLQCKLTQQQKRTARSQKCPQSQFNVNILLVKLVNAQ